MDVLFGISDNMREYVYTHDRDIISASAVAWILACLRDAAVSVNSEAGLITNHKHDNTPPLDQH